MFSGPSRAPPRWANGIGPGWSRNSNRGGVTPSTVGRTLGPVTQSWPRPVPVVGDRTSASERAEDPAGWAFPLEQRQVLGQLMASRRDIRRFRPDPVPAVVLSRLFEAAHQAPSVGHSQPWRFVVVRGDDTRAKAAVLADRARLRQAQAMDIESARHLLDLDLEGIREAPLGVVVCCDRRAPAAGVLGRATFVDADMWSCACAIENFWLAARAEGLGVGWVTLFEPDELAGLVGAPPGVATLGWLCVGWPDERPPTPGLERRGWSERLAVESVVIEERWPDDLAAPISRLASAPPQSAVVAAHDTADQLLSPPGSLGVLDRAVDRLLAIGVPSPALAPGALVLVAADHPVTGRGVSAYEPRVTRDVAEAAVAGLSVGAVAAAHAGLELAVVDAGVEGPPLAGARSFRPADRRGDLEHTDALSAADCARLVECGQDLSRELAGGGFRVFGLGEVGVGNTTVAAALAAALLEVGADQVVGLGAGSDSAIVEAKRRVVTAAMARVGRRDALGYLSGLGGGEVAVLTGFILGAAAEGAAIVLDGMLTGVAGLAAVELEPAVAAHLVAGQRSREMGHPLVLQALGLEPLLDLRFRAGEGAGAAMAVSLLRAGLAVRLGSARTATR